LTNGPNSALPGNPSYISLRKSARAFKRGSKLLVKHEPSLERASLIESPAPRLELAATAIIAANFLIHIFYGFTFFLYAGHVLPSIYVLLILWLRRRGMLDSLGYRLAFIAFGALMLLNNALFAHMVWMTYQ
jgi:hypothetical protein